MGSAAIKNTVEQSPIQKALVFLICLGRLDGPLYDNDIVFAILILLAGLGLIFNLSSKFLAKSQFTKWQLVLLLYFVLTILWAYDRNKAMLVTAAYFGRTIIILYIYSYLLKTNNIIHLCKSFIFATLFTLFHFLIVYGVSGMIMLRAEEITLEGAQGWNANALGMMCVVSCFFILFLMPLYVKAMDFYRLFIIPFLFFFILLTGSKTSFFLIVGSIAFYYFLKSKNKLLTSIVLLLSLIIVLILIFNVPFLYEIMGERVEQLLMGGFADVNSTDRTASDRVRLVMWAEGISWFSQRPLLGYGTSNFQVLFSEINSGTELYAHNNYIELLVDGGLVALIIYYYLYIYIIRHSVKELPSNYRLSVIAFVVVLMIAELGQVSYLLFCIQLFLCIIMWQLKYSNTYTSRSFLQKKIR